MLNDFPTRWLMPAIAFAAPILLVKSAGVIMGVSQPKSAEATPQPAVASQDLVPSRSIEQSPDSVATMEHLEALRDQSFGSSPWYYPERPTVEKPSEPAEEQVPEPEFRVTVGATMASPRGHMALINGDRYRVGETLDGWIIEAIDPEERAVTLRQKETGKEITEYVERGP